MPITRDTEYTSSSALSIRSALSSEEFQIHIGDLIKEDRYDEAIHEVFDEIDIDKSQSLGREEMFEFFQAASERINIKVEEKVIHLAIDALFDDVGATPDAQFISREQFFELFRRNPDLYYCFETDSDSVSQRARQSRSELSIEERNLLGIEARQVWQHQRSQWKNKGLAVTWLILYAAAVSAVFISAAIKWNNEEEAIAVFGSCIIVARASAATLNLHAALILLPMCRHFLTLLRSTYARFLFPFDVSLEAHILVGVGFCVFATSHVLAHVCDYVRAVDADQDDLEALLGHALPDIPESKSGRLRLFLKERATITGIIMVLCMLVAYPTARETNRRSNFNRFWYLHHLLVVMLVMMAVHGTGNLLQPFQSIYWMCGPLALYILPRLYREFDCRRVQVKGLKMVHEDAFGLQLEKPQGWDKSLRAGMYAFINIPAISRFEWHPFTLASAPSQEHIAFYIKCGGDWTKKAKQVLKECEAEASDLRASHRGVVDCPVVRVEGPIGASSQGFSDHEVVVLIGAGIGITPMISVIRELLTNPGKMQRAFFYWTCRDISAFDWFESLMEEIYERDTKKVLEIRHFLTSAKRDDRDLGAVLFHYAANAVHADTHLDIVLGHRARQKVAVGRPNWETELRHVMTITKELGGDDCGVFLCGPEKLADDVAETSAKLSAENPDFHLHFAKETF